MASTASCVVRLRDGSACRSVATEGAYCAHHARVREELGADGPPLKRQNARERIPVMVESDPLELVPRSPGTPAAVRPTLALTAAEEVETRSGVFSSRLRPAAAGRAGLPAPVRSAARASDRRSPFPITERGSRRSRHCSGRVSVASRRRMRLRHARRQLRKK